MSTDPSAFLSSPGVCDERLCGAAAVDGIGVGLAKECRHALRHFRRERGVRLLTLIEWRREIVVLVFVREPRVRFLDGLLKNFLGPGVGMERLALLNADGL